MKSYNILKLSVGEFLKVLQDKTRENADKMKEIYDYTISIKKTEPDSEERRTKLKNALLLNNEFIGINKKYIDAHNNILEIINRIASDDDPELSYAEEEEEQFGELNSDYMLNDEIEPDIEDSGNNNLDNLEKFFDYNNPLLQDKEYTDSLMRSFIEQEEYEKCEMLQRYLDNR